jgi:RNA polymerase primary sigma factor
MGKNMKDQIAEFIVELEKDYSFVNLNKDELLAITNEVIKQYPQASFIDIKNYYMHYLHELVGKKLQADFTNSINAYINDKLPIANDKKSAINILDNLETFFYSNFFTPSFDQYLIMFKNKKFKDIISFVIPKGITSIAESSLNRLTKSENLISLMEAYCIDNNIDIVESVDNSEYDLSTLDSTALFYNSLPKRTLTIKEEKDLFNRLKQGDTSVRDTIIKYNMRLVCSVARNQHDFGNGMDFLDKVTEGYFGLDKAIDRFDIDRNYKFSTYAIWWIRQTIARAIANQSRFVRLPVHIDAKVKKYNWLMNDAKEKDEHNYTDEELCELLSVTPNELEFIKSSNREIVSLNNSVNHDEDNDSELGDFVADANANIEKDALSNSMRDEVLALLKNSTLNDREKNILLYRYGFIDGIPHTLEYVGQIYKITRERVRQIEGKALKKLHRKAAGLKEYIDIPDDKDNHNESHYDYHSFLNLFSLFPEYTHDEIRQAFYKLSKEEKIIWYKKNGINVFDGTKTNDNLTRSEYYQLHNNIYKHLIKLLELASEKRKKDILLKTAALKEDKAYPVSHNSSNYDINVNIESTSNTRPKARIKVKVK